MWAAKSHAALQCLHEIKHHYVLPVRICSELLQRGGAFLVYSPKTLFNLRNLSSENRTINHDPGLHGAA
jgi:hypothetical protein